MLPRPKNNTQSFVLFALPEIANRHHVATSAFLDEANRDTLILEAAVFTARVRHNPEKAEIWFKRAANLQRVPTLIRLRAQTTLSVHSERYGDAIREIEEGIDFIRRTPDNKEFGGQEAARSKWRDQIESRQRAAVTFGPS